MSYGKRIIVGIKGTKGSGKDTIAGMIHYIMAAGPSYAEFTGWELYNKTERDELDVPTLHFADKLKDDLSVMFGINRECFDSQEYKEEKYYHFRTNSFRTKKMQREYPINEITIENLKENSLYNWRESFNDDCVIKLRTLMQYYGTEIIRNQIGKNTWINVIKNKAIEHKNYFGYAIVADVRFDNENKAIYDIGGKVIHVFRGKHKDAEHDSEDIVPDVRDYEIENDGSLLGLFYKVLEFVKAEMI